MNMKKTLLFILIVAIVAFASFTAINGIEIGGKKISKVQDSIDLGLDLAGGVYVILEAQTDLQGQELQRAMEQSKMIINERVDGLGVAEPNITIEGNNRIRIELAGVENPQEAIDIIGKTAQLQFIDPEGNEVLTGKNVKVSEVSFNKTDFGEKPVVVLEFDKEGAAAFKEATTKLAGNQKTEDKIIYIVLDDQVISAPVVKNAISEGKAIIEGQFDVEEANRLATLIRAGALPVEMSELQSRVIGPTLGLEALERSIKAGGIAILIIFLFMLIYYKVPGLVADIGLTIYILIVLFAMKFLGVKLTLPGIAGLILSIGMAVDANVLIFERIKEELRNGKTIRASIDHGFNRALTSVLDSNITTLIAGIVLYYFGIGPIKGFGVTLILGIVASMITSVFITKHLLKLTVEMTNTNNKKLYGLSSDKKHRKVNVIKNRKIYYIISSVIIIVGLIMTIANGLNYGIDFTGGTSIQMKIGKEISVDEAREILDEFDKEASIVHIGENKDEIMIRSKMDFSNEDVNEIIDNFAEKYNIEEKEFQSEKFGPFMGKEIRNKALLSSAIAVVAMLIYISWRFEFKFAIAAIIALAHDVLVTFAVYAVFKIPVNSAFIAAILTILGYSINDTIVIFDRIREETKLNPKAKREDLINSSISKSLTRTINTSITTLVAVVLLYILGVEDVRVLALPLIFGMISGTYSSLFIASPVWYEMKN